MLPNSKTVPVRADGVQKLLLYLILLNYWLLYLYAAHIFVLPAGLAALVSLLCIAYNLLLCRLTVRRARRQTDGYIVYPVLIGAVLFCGLMLYVFIIRG